MSLHVCVTVDDLINSKNIYYEPVLGNRIQDEPSADPAHKENIRQALKCTMKSNKLDYMYVMLWEWVNIKLQLRKS